MKCPRDGSDLVVEIRHDVEIDVCPTCYGIWLDHEELTKIMDVVHSKQGKSRNNNSVLDYAPMANGSPQRASSTDDIGTDVSTDAGGGIGDFFSDLFDGL